VAALSAIFSFFYGESLSPSSSSIDEIRIGIVKTSVKDVKKPLLATPKNVILADASYPKILLGPMAKTENVEVINAKRIIEEF
jgi:hypothetical protein